jgi:hypothetical protein
MVVIVAGIERDLGAKCTAYKVLNNLGRHHPRKRVIQYSRDVCDRAEKLGVLDTRFRGV